MIVIERLTPIVTFEPVLISGDDGWPEGFPRSAQEAFLMLRKGPADRKGFNDSEQAYFEAQHFAMVQGVPFTPELISRFRHS